MHLFFKENDYNETFKSRLVWNCFCKEMFDILKAKPPSGDKKEKDYPKLYNFTECLRWLYRFLIVLVAEVPRTDLTHSTAAAFCSIPCVISKLAYNTPFILTEHGVYLREQYIFISKARITYHSKKFLLALISLISRMSYHYADQISPVCNYNATWEIANGAKREKIKTIYNGVDPSTLNPKETAHKPHSVIVSATRVDPLKDIETLIRASLLVRQKVSSVKFVIYGSLRTPWYYEHCRKLAHSLGVGDIFEFAGHSDDLDRIYGEGDIVALSSISEAFPYTVIEAMMYGKAVIATDVGGVREALEGCGVLVKPRDPEGFSRAILQLLKDDKLRNALGTEAREKALNNFTIDRVIKEYKESYLALITR
ncbi:TPA: glycosyl transferase [bacterium]|nr:glycosyl transferase [bacterium]